MPVTFDILTERGLVYIRYEGYATVAEGLEAFGTYMRHPAYRPGQKQLVDLSRVTELENNYPQLLAFQARKAEAFVQGMAQTLIVYYANSPLTDGMARTILKSWQGITSVVAMVQDTEARALSVLGQPETAFADLLAGAD